MNRLVHIVNSMNYKELKEIQMDLVEGNLARLVRARINSIEKVLEHNKKVCPVCGNNVSEQTAKYVLIFGPQDFKKKAMFCGMDCLSFFIEKLKQEQILRK